MEHIVWSRRTLAISGASSLGLVLVGIIFSYVEGLTIGCATEPAVERYFAAQIQRPLVNAHTRIEEVGKNYFN